MVFKPVFGGLFYLFIRVIFGMFLPLFLTAFSVVFASLYAVADPGGGGDGGMGPPLFLDKTEARKSFGGL